MKKTVLITAIVVASIPMNAQTLNYPKTHKDNTIDEYFGVKVADPYRWLEDDNSAQTAEWVEADTASALNAFEAVVSVMPEKSIVSLILTTAEGSASCTETLIVNSLDSIS